MYSAVSSGLKRGRCEVELHCMIVSIINVIATHHPYESFLFSRQIQRARFEENKYVEYNPCIADCCSVT